MLVPERVMAFTCTPDERPCVASNRFEMNWNSRDRVAAEPRLAAGAELLVTCWPSMFSWNSRTSPRSCTGTLPIAVVRLPGAISASDVQSRPWTGSS